MASHFLRLRGVRQNNLRGFDLDLPLGKLIVVTGPSGSGKSSLAFDTIYAEGQRRYVETFSPYTRQFLERMDRPAVDSVEGIPPAIAIEQSNRVRTTRSTVGTITEINDYMKLFFARIAAAFCPSCERRVRPETAADIVDHALEAFPGEAMLVAFQVPVGEDRSDPAAFFDFLKSQGYLRVWWNGKIERTDEGVPADKLPAIVQVIQDRVKIAASERTRIVESVETALHLGKGKVVWIHPKTGECHPASRGWHCAHCDLDIRPPSPGLFTFNNPLGACPDCRGFGRVIGIDLERALPDRSLSISSGVVKAFNGAQSQECQRDLLKACARQDIDIYTPFQDLPKTDQDFVLYGEGSGPNLWESGLWYGVKGFFDWMETKTYKMHVRVFLSRYRSYNPCPTCHGGRFQPATLNFRLLTDGSDAESKTLPQVAATPVGELRSFIDRVPLPEGDPAALLLRDQIRSRLGYLHEVGLGYLTLDRPTRSLSGGEIQRVNLTTCLGASLVNTLFVMDEPSVGLHPRDVGRLLHVMAALRDKGNTLLVVEHEEAVLRSADHIVDIGPGRGEQGGRLVYSGPLEGLAAAPDSLTAEYLSGAKAIAVPSVRRRSEHSLRIEGARHHNIRNLDIEIPLGVFCVVTGVSGSGKSTLVRDILYRNLVHEPGSEDVEPAGHCDRIEGAEHFDEVLMVDQSSLARTPRSTPAVYLGVFEAIREIFGYLPEANSQGMTPATFSFNAGTGRCERCHGLGFEKVDMQFLSDLFLRCPECDGKRYQPRVLKILFEGKSIHDVLEMTVREAIEFFTGREKKSAITGPLRLLAEVGLDYLRLGQPVNVLSGGESQRLKLVSHLAEKRGKRALLIFDEPTTGLHFDDVAQLLGVFQKLVDAGNSLVVIEHNLEVLKTADWVIDLGPEAGSGGGEIVTQGTPETVAAHPTSHTGRHLQPILNGERRLVAEEFVLPTPALAPPDNCIRISGAREHNLKNINVSVPREKMVVVTGLSGSGKSTLAFDILFAEGQRRFLDSMSPYARQFVEQLEKPDVDLIEGLPPSVAIEQRITRGGGKSTVATVTEIHHFLRLLFAKLGVQHCPQCNVPVESNTVSAIASLAADAAKKGTVRIFAPLIRGRKGYHAETAAWAVRNGYATMLVDGKLVNSDAFPRLERFKEHSIDVLIGEISAKNADQSHDIVQRAVRVGKGTARLTRPRGGDLVLSTEMSCPGCARSFEPLDPRLFSFNSPHGWCPTCRGFGEVWEKPWEGEGESEIETELAEERARENEDEQSSRPCSECRGGRINEVARFVRVKSLSLPDICECGVADATKLLGKLRFTAAENRIARDILIEVNQRLEFLKTVGLDYLALGRSARSLSGGESQRIRLAAQLGSNLQGVLYVLDEPTIGLHSRDNAQLLQALDRLVSNGNTLVVVEHDEDTMRRADHIIDLGPRAGSFGGEIVAEGTLAQIEANPRSLTGRFLSHPLKHPISGKRRSVADAPAWLELEGASLRNLKSVNLRIPLHRLSVVTGVSGSGKSTLLRGVLLPALRDAASTRHSRKIVGGNYHTLRGHESIVSVQEVDQSPIGKTSRSTPATYMKVLDEIRKHFAQLPAARMRGYTASRFSFNNEGGRCEICQGQGVIKLEMSFLPTSYMPCEACGGSRYNAQTLEVEYNGRSMGEVLEMTAEQAGEFFAAYPKIARPLRLLMETGLGYLKLGQPSPTLSGGEAQRLKLVTELSRRGGQKGSQTEAKTTFYLLEEPTIGLHLADVEQLLHLLHRLVDEGATVVVIEHNMELIAEADYIIDVGPEAGAQGGEIVVENTPEIVAKSTRSRTAPFLKAVLERK